MLHKFTTMVAIPTSGPAETKSKLQRSISQQIGSKMDAFAAFLRLWKGKRYKL